VTRARTALFLLCLLIVGGRLHAGTPGEVQVGELLKDADLAGLNGAGRKLSDFRGKPLIINMWASWCGPCRAEMASLERLAWLDPAGHFGVIGISTDDFPEPALAFLKKANSTINQFIDTRLQMENMLGANRLPLTVLVDAGGRVVDKVYGAREWDDPESLRLIEKAFRVKLAPPR
jgi:thiol-disulfide isomerase/thioredoxin